MVLKMVKVLKTHNAAGSSSTSISFDDEGEHLIATAEDESLQLFGARNGKHLKQAFSKKKTAAPSPGSLTNHRPSSTRQQKKTVRLMTLMSYVSLSCRERVVSLEMSPRDDTVLSGSTDDTVRLWNLRSPSCQVRSFEYRRTTLRRVRSIWPSLCNCTQHETNNLALRSLRIRFCLSISLRSRNILDCEPFIAKHIEDPVLAPKSVHLALIFQRRVKASRWDSRRYSLRTGRIQWSPRTGICTPPLDSMFPGQSGSSEETTWTPDSRYVISGSADGKVFVWDVQPPKDDPIHAMCAPQSPHTTWQPLKVYDGHLGNPSRCVGFNPRLGMLATAATELSFWLPGSGGSTNPVQGDVQMNS
ncbi:hypothetical protein PSTT_07510 [Puccinia striiformis]|uniref:Anaphase-promoting complex subunit 4 WD40 domain-containing protein n=1 Tax=Puccinia striiformis TaxID=27350 RepID=A0A2S4VG67_9BASI|nr:hypothetical protein PSTT_07510 [Puccinia striiformis]